MAVAKTETKTVLMKVLLGIALIGAINWGLIGFFNFNLVDAIFGGGAREATSGISRVIYALVGLSGLGAIGYAFRGDRDRHLGPPRTV